MLNKNTLLQFWRFGVAGAIGFAVDVALLYLCLAAGTGFYPGRLVSFLGATLVTWQINRHFAFRGHETVSLWRQWWQYLFVVLGGGVVNYLVSALMIQFLPPHSWLPLLSVAAGSIAGMLVNFINTRVFVFRR